LKLGGPQYLDGRSWQALHIKKLIRQWTAQLNLRPDSTLVPALRAAAELSTICEMRRAELLATGTGDLATTVRLENELRRRLERLGLDQPAAPEKRLSLAERLRAEANGGGSRR
jgi:hypothetical protein